jgi:hypothetical protein
MALKLRVKTIEEVDEAQRGLYVADTLKGGFILDAEDVGKIDEFRSNNRAYSAQLEAWKALGMTAEQAKAKIEEARERENANLSAADLKTKFEQQLAAERATWQAEKAGYLSKLDRFEVLEPLRQAAIKAGAIPADVEDLLEAPSVKRRYRKGEDGALQFLADDGTPLLGATPTQFFENLAKEKPRYFQPVNPGGSDTKPNPQKQQDPNARKISASDQAALNSTSLEDLASGKVVVVEG